MVKHALTFWCVDTPGQELGEDIVAIPALAYAILPAYNIQGLVTIL